MSNTSVKVAMALFMVLTSLGASFARGGHGGGHAGSAAMGGFARPAGSAATGNVPISGIARGPANAGGINNSVVDPSGVGNASKVAAAAHKCPDDSAVQVMRRGLAASHGHWEPAPSPMLCKIQLMVSADCEPT